MKRSYFSAVILALVLAFLYVPIILVVVYGFIPNGDFIGFTGKWYSMILLATGVLKRFWRAFGFRLR